MKKIILISVALFSMSSFAKEGQTWDVVSAVCADGSQAQDQFGIWKLQYIISSDKMITNYLNIKSGDLMYSTTSNLVIKNGLLITSVVSGSDSKKLEELYGIVAKPQIAKLSVYEYSATPTTLTLKGTDLDYSCKDNSKVVLTLK